jgi:hypothetical protein
LLARAPAEVRWLEIHPENFLERGGLYRALLDRCRERWPIVTHGLTMGFGSATAPTRARLRELRDFLQGIDAPWHSDHLCFADVDGAFAHELLPVPFNDETLGVVCERVTAMRDEIERPVLIENTTYYATFDESDRDEVTFLREALERSDASMLLDVNNVYVNSRNHGFDAEAWLERVPFERVRQIHVAGHLVREDGLRIDTHGERVCDPVLELLESVLRRTGPVPVLLERDANFASFDELLDEVRALDAIYRRATGEKP